MLFKEKSTVISLGKSKIYTVTLNISYLVNSISIEHKFSQNKNNEI